MPTNIASVTNNSVCHESSVADDLDLTTLDLEAYWTSGETYAALGYDTEPMPVRRYVKPQK